MKKCLWTFELSINFPIQKSSVDRRDLSCLYLRKSETAAQARDFVDD
jgi:hypothetical protein